MRKILLLIAVIFFAAGCQTPHTFYFPATSGQIPEVSGRLWGGSAEVNMASAAGVEIIRDIKTNPPSTDNTTTNGALLFSGTNFLVALGVSERIELFVNKGGGVRYQYMGEPRKEGWKGTVFAEAYSSGVGTTHGTLGAADYADAQTRASGYRMGTSLGFSPVESNLIFGTVMLATGQAKTTLKQDAGREFQFDDNFRSFLISLGARIGKAWYFQYEGSVTYVQWPRVADTWVGGGNLGFGYQW